MKEFFRPLIVKACAQWLGDQVNERLKNALQGQAPVVPVVAPMAKPEDPGVQEQQLDGVETTLEELEGYNIVRAIAVAEIEPERIVMRDTKSYCGILVDDNNRKPLCRLRFNATSVKYLGLFDEDKKETKHPIDKPVDIYKFADQIREAASRFR